VSALSSKGDMRTEGGMNERHKLCGLTLVGTFLKGVSFDLLRVVTLTVLVRSPGSNTQR